MLRVVGCILERPRSSTEKEFLVMRRLPHKYDGDKWGIPSGKVEYGESDISAILREVHEECGYRVSESELSHLGEYIGATSGGEHKLTYPTFKITLPDKSFEAIIETAAHSEHRWVTPQEAVNLDLVHGLPRVFAGIGYWSVEMALEIEPNDEGDFILL